MSEHALHASPSLQLLEALAWYARTVLDLERAFARVTVKRRRNLARPIKRRKSAFRDPMMCLDLVAMAWLGATRLSHIESHLRDRSDLAHVFGLPRFSDHTTAHNFLNDFHLTHLRQLEDVNLRLLRDHGAACAQRRPILDIDVAQRTVRRPGRRSVLYRWAVAFSAGEALAQQLCVRSDAWEPMIVDVVERARRALSHKPVLVRLPGSCTSPELLRALVRRRLAFVATTTWKWALEQRSTPRGPLRWATADEGCRALDLGPAAMCSAPHVSVRTVLVERPALAPALRCERLAIVTTLLDTPPAGLAALATHRGSINRFFDGRDWPFHNGKFPSSDPRGVGAYLRLSAIAINALVLFARHLGGEWTPSRLLSRIRLIAKSAL